MVDLNQVYHEWCEKVTDPDLQKELKSIWGKSRPIADRFFKVIDFGTAGLRGELGAGTNFMNIYTVRRATQGIADYMNNNNLKSVAISYDSRYMSKEFATETACVFAQNGIVTYLVSELQPTPVLSFIVREMKCDVGIMITASHNPASYNGYKVYGNDGCQVTSKVANDMKECINNHDFFGIETMDFNKAIEKNLISYVPHDVILSFTKKVYSTRLLKQDLNNVSVVYTPLNGTGWILVPKALLKADVGSLTFVEEQLIPDPSFKTCPFPNPEIRESLELGIKKAKTINADILIATDPDCDRVGCAVLHNGEYTLISGNEMGVLLSDYILKMRAQEGSLPQNGIIVKTIVTTELINKIAAKYNVEVKNVLTGFKYIGEIITNLEKEGKEDNYIFGFEESYGYLPGTYVRDKEAVSTSLLITEMTAYYKERNMTLVDALNVIYNEYGYYLHKLYNFYFDGAAGFTTMINLMSTLRNDPLTHIGGLKVLEMIDYSQGINGLPKADVVVYKLEAGSQIVIRPSGTEPKLKVYATAVGNKEECNDVIIKMQDWLNKFIKEKC